MKNFRPLASLAALCYAVCKVDVCSLHTMHTSIQSCLVKTPHTVPLFGKKHVLTSWRGGEQGSSRGLAVTVWELRPVLQLDHTGRDGTAPGLLCIS